VSPRPRNTRPKASVLLTTYNQPRALDFVLHGYARQSRQDFEVLIADDGSGPETAKVIERHVADYPVRLVHVWQPDDGFHKTRAVNRAALQSRAPYLILSDGDCIPARDHVATHLAAARPNRFIVGGHVRLSPEETAALTLEDVHSGSFEALVTPAERRRMQKVHWKALLYILLNLRRKPKCYGTNFSVAREDFFRVNGFDENYRNAGREDSDLRNRLQLAGLRATSLWNRCSVYHQHHPSHTTRLIWTAVDAYYNRPDIRPEAPRGLRELAAEIVGEEAQLFDAEGRETDTNAL
jgi:glycosyltransferase involved in cell wall biosynthesis